MKATGIPMEKMLKVKIFLEDARSFLERGARELEEGIKSGTTSRLGMRLRSSGTPPSAPLTP